MKRKTFAQRLDRQLAKAPVTDVTRMEAALDLLEDVWAAMDAKSTSWDLRYDLCVRLDGIRYKDDSADSYPMAFNQLGFYTWEWLREKARELQLEQVVEMLDFDKHEGLLIDARAARVRDLLANLSATA